MIPNRCVLDASIMARWWLKSGKVAVDQAARTFLLALRAGDLEVVVPSLAYAEVGNALWKQAQFSDWSPDDVKQSLRDLVDLRLESWPADGHIELAVSLALEHKITVYDALYVALAMDLGLPLYTLDQKLAKLRGIAEIRGLV